MTLYDEFFAAVGAFERAGVRYAVVGGIALAFHGFPRFTRDIDLLVVPEDAAAAAAALESVGYFESAEPWTFANTNVTLRRFMKTAGVESLVIDLLVGNESWHRDVVAAALVAESSRTTVRFAGRDDLIRLKRQRNSTMDQADIERLSDDEGRAGPSGVE